MNKTKIKRKLVNRTFRKIKNRNKTRQIKKIYNKYELLLYNNRHMITNKDKLLNNHINPIYLDV